MSAVLVRSGTVLGAALSSYLVTKLLFQVIHVKQMGHLNVPYVSEFNGKRQELHAEQQGTQRISLKHAPAKRKKTGQP
jgi:hypothetical protein